MAKATSRKSGTGEREDPFPFQEKSLLTLSEASDMMGVSKVTLRRWTAIGAFPCVRIGRRNDRRFRSADIEEFIRSHLHEPGLSIVPRNEPETESS